MKQTKEELKQTKSSFNEELKQTKLGYDMYLSIKKQLDSCNNFDCIDENIDKLFGFVKIINKKLDECNFECINENMDKLFLTIKLVDERMNKLIQTKHDKPLFG